MDSSPRTAESAVHTRLIQWMLTLIYNVRVSSPLRQAIYLSTNQITALLMKRNDKVLQLQRTFVSLTQTESDT